MFKTSESSGRMKLWWVFGFMGLVIIKVVEGFEDANVTDMHYVNFNSRALMVGLTLVNGAAAKGAGISSSFLMFFSAIIFHRKWIFS